ncbi:transglycosylase domain-containing protein [Patescibacteria group bacterium]
MKNMKKKNKIIIIGIGVLLFLAAVVFYIWSGFAAQKLINEYNSRESEVATDINGEVIYISLNKNEYYAKYITEIPKDLSDKILEKEDKYYYYHFGVNPISSFKVVALGENRGASTITQQLSKILLNNERQRTLSNKITELFYAIALEVHLSKDEILKMYLNTIFLGNNAQGVDMASRLYFERSPDQLTQEQIALLANTISSPTNNNPFKKMDPNEAALLKENFNKHISNDAYFEYKDVQDSSNILIDSELTAKIREIINENLIPLSKKAAHHAAVVVIKFPENHVIAVVGSPDPNSQLPGDQINMAIKPRPIGSTIKPFLYAKGFSEGLRPYTLVDDREYKYTTALGFAHYPKNYDYVYRGIVSLHESLSNSLNVPSVKVLEFIGLDEFYRFLLDDLEIEPIQPLDNYQYGIALGHLEMSLYDLANKFTIFSQKGKLADKQVVDEKYIQLTNKILSDRSTGSDQFGLIGNLHTNSNNVAVKTGTSREYHDSWTIGYTPDFLVGVWVGNANNTPMDGLTGQAGAGVIWNDVMRFMLNSQYSLETEFNFDLIESFDFGETIEFGLALDDYDEIKNLMIDESLIVYPHDNDEYLYVEGMEITLRSNEEVKWQVNDEEIGTGKVVQYYPLEEGYYSIEALDEEGDKEQIQILISTPEL